MDGLYKKMNKTKQYCKQKQSYKQKQILAPKCESKESSLLGGHFARQQLTNLFLFTLLWKGIHFCNVNH